MWSLFERSIPRLASAVVMLTLAALTSPDIVGIYAWAALALTLISACSDTAIRQIIITLFEAQTSIQFLRRYQRLSAILGSGAMLLAIAALAASTPNALMPHAASLLPMALVPSVIAVSIAHVGYLQLRQEWRLLAGMQLWAALGGLAIAVPTLLMTGSLVAAALQTLITELIVAVLARNWAQRLGEREFITRLPPATARPNEFWHSVVLCLLGWAQSQSDRLFVGLMGGTQLLGLFNTGWALGRSGSEALGAATANVMRSHMRDAETESADRQREHMSRLLMLSVVAGLAIGLVTMLASDLIVRPVLGPEWTSAIDAAVVLAICTPAVAVSWALSAALASRARIKWGTPAKAVGIVLSLVIALAALQSLVWAALVVLAREWIVLLLSGIALKLGLPWRAIAAGILATGVMAGLAILLLSVQ